MNASDTIEQSSRAFRTAWTVTPIAYDIGALDPLKLSMPGLSSPSEGRPCKRIICGGAGNLVVTGLDGIDVTLVALAGTVFDIQAAALKATSTATNVMVFW